MKDNAMTDKIEKDIAFFREQVAANRKQTPYGEGLPAPWAWLEAMCDIADDMLAQLSEAQARLADDVVRDYPEGWVFHSADFSMAASCPARSGRVTLVRDLAGRDWWLSLSDEDKERVPLYVYGSGNTLSDAIKDAALLAAAQQQKEGGE